MRIFAGTDRLDAAERDEDAPRLYYKKTAPRRRRIIVVVVAEEEMMWQSP